MYFIRDRTNAGGSVVKILLTIFIISGRALKFFHIGKRSQKKSWRPTLDYMRICLPRLATVWLETTSLTVLLLAVLAMLRDSRFTSWSEGSMMGHNQGTSASRRSCWATEFRAAFNCSCWGGSNCCRHTDTQLLRLGPGPGHKVNLRKKCF